MIGTPWTAEEDALLRTAYASGIRAAIVALPHRSENAIYHRANRIIGAARKRPWSDDDNEKLRLNWDASHTLQWIAKELGRTPQATYQHAKEIGLPVGCPQGYETLPDSARRTGYSTCQLRRIMRRAGLPVRRALSYAKARGKRYVVEPQDVDDAIAKWLESEPCETAARRHDIRGRTLRHRLAVIGISGPRGRSHFRVTDEQVRVALSLRVVSQRLQPPQDRPA